MVTPPAISVLESLATIFRSTLRQVDFVFRVAGDDFSILLPNTDLEGGKHVRERIQDRVESSDLLPALGLAEKVTVSIGVCEYQPGQNTVSFIRRAEEALSRAKRKGDDGMSFVPVPAT